MSPTEPVKEPQSGLLWRLQRLMLALATFARGDLLWSARARPRPRADLTDEPPRRVDRVSNEGELIPENQGAQSSDPFDQGGAPPTRDRGEAETDPAIEPGIAARPEATSQLEPGSPIMVRPESSLRAGSISRPSGPLWESAEAANAQALQAIVALKLQQQETVRQRGARETAEAQLLPLIEDLRASQEQAVAFARQLERAYFETITALAKATEARNEYTGIRDEYTGGHVERVRRHSVGIGKQLGLSGEALRHLEMGAVLHDIGTIGIPDAILRKHGPLTPAEWQIMRQHPEAGCQLLKGIRFLALALDAVRSHHERWDGQGYPDGLAGEAIPLAGRIVAVADTYDAMTSDRPHRRGLPVEGALAELERERGSQFDPQVVSAFLVHASSDASP